MAFLTTEAFLKKLKKDEKYCFILGAGASVTSGIPGGATLAYRWLEEIRQSTDDYSAEIKRRISVLNNGYDYDRFLNNDYEPHFDKQLDDYNAINELRFCDNREEEKEQLFELMNEAIPYWGYRYLADVVTKSHNNIIISTNFDELAEDAIWRNTDVKPFVIMDERIAEFATVTYTHRPKILKVHRDITTGGFNTREETSKLKEQWEKPLQDLFNEYIPIVIGYAGTDKSLTPFLLNAKLKGIYWCHMKGSLPNDTVRNIIKNGDGDCVEIAGFDEIMYKIVPALGVKRTSRWNMYRKTLRQKGYATKGKRRKAIRESGTQTKKYISRLISPISYAAMFIAMIGELYEKKKLYEPALKYYQKAADYESRCHDRFYGKSRFKSALLLDKMHRLIEAGREYRSVIDNPTDEPDNEKIRGYAKNNLSIVYLEDEKPEISWMLCNELLYKYRNDGVVFRIKGIAEYFLHRLDDANNTLEEAVMCHLANGEIAHAARDYLHKGLVNYKRIGDGKADFQKTIDLGSTIDGFQTTVFLANRYLSNDYIADEEIKNVMLMRAGEQVKLVD